MKTYENIEFDINEGVAIISLNRPDVLNSFNFEMADDTIDALTYSRDDKSIRTIVLTANGKGFCAGQDLEEATRENGPNIEEIIEHTYNPIVDLIRNIEKPVICAVNGVAAGAGANIAIACDITFAAESANFIQSFTNIGLVPDSGGTFFLPRLIGLQRATAMLFSGDKTSAIEAKEMGMIYETVSDKQLMPVVLDFAKKLSKRPTKAFGLTKKALNNTFTNSLEEQLVLEQKLQAIAAKTDDHQEGIKAFFEKRRPNYTGE